MITAATIVDRHAPLMRRRIIITENSCQFWPPVCDHYSSTLATRNIARPRSKGIVANTTRFLTIESTCAGRLSGSKSCATCKTRKFRSSGIINHFYLPVGASHRGAASTQTHPLHSLLLLLTGSLRSLSHIRATGCDCRFISCVSS